MKEHRPTINMQKCLSIILLFCIIISCGRSNSEIKEKSLEILSSGEAINYRYSKLTIQGSSEEDTTFIEILGAASFYRDPKDTIVGYKYLIQDSLIHPYFGVPIKTSYHHDVDRFYTCMISSIRNSLQDQSFSELNKEVYHNVMVFQVPAIVNMIRNNEVTFLEDSIIRDEKCVHLYVMENGFPHHLFISRKTNLPVMMRVVTNYFQPFIQENYYSDFKFSSEFSTPDFKAEMDKAPEPTIQAALKKGDQLPEWSLMDLSGNKVTMKASNKIKVIYLSMINCGPCQVAIPYVNKIEKMYKNSNVVDFHILYPYDSKEKLKKYVKTKGIETPILFNSYEEEPERIGLIMSLEFGYPSVLFVGKDNQILNIIHGFSTSIGDRVKKSVQEIVDKEIKEKCP